MAIMLCVTWSAGWRRRRPRRCPWKCPFSMWGQTRASASEEDGGACLPRRQHNSWKFEYSLPCRRRCRRPFLARSIREPLLKKFPLYRWRPFYISHLVDRMTRMVTEKLLLTSTGCFTVSAPFETPFFFGEGWNIMKPFYVVNKWGRFCLMYNTPWYYWVMGMLGKFRTRLHLRLSVPRRPVARPRGRAGGIQKAKRAKNDCNVLNLPSIVMGDLIQFEVIFTVAVVSKQASRMQEQKNKKPLCTCPNSLWLWRMGMSKFYAPITQHHKELEDMYSMLFAFVMKGSTSVHSSTQNGPKKYLM